MTCAGSLSGMNRSIFYYLVIGAVVGLLLSGVVGDPFIGVGLGLVIGLVAFFLRNRMGGKGGGRGSFGGGDAYQELLAKARGDQSLVNRLMAFEEKRNPNGNKQQWADDALDRWERDRA